MAPIAVNLDREAPFVGIVSLIGEHDAYSAPRLENELSVLLDERIAIVVDLTEATFIDSQTLSVLLGARHRAEGTRLGFVLALLDDRYNQVHRILDMTGLASAFAIAPSVRRAIVLARSGHSSGTQLKVA